MVKHSLLPFLSRGATTLLQHFHYVYWPRHTSRHTIYSKYCSLSPIAISISANVISAELEMTVNMLIQIDKLVQLLESPVFTCKLTPMDIKYTTDSSE